MGKLLQFGKNKKNYTLPVGKKGKELENARLKEAEEAVKCLRQAFSDEQVEEIKRDLLKDPE